MIFNIVLYLDAGEHYFNDLGSFAYPCTVEDTKTILFCSVILKLTLFILMVFTCKKEKLKYLSEILIFYFLFDFGQIGLMMLCDIINAYIGRVRLNGFCYFASNFELIFHWFHINSYIICLIWSLSLGIFLWKTKRFSIGYFAKRFTIMPLSCLTYAISKYYYLYHFVWHK